MPKPHVPELCPALLYGTSEFLTSFIGSFWPHYCYPLFGGDRKTLTVCRSSKLLVHGHIEANNCNSLVAILPYIDVSISRFLPIPIHFSVLYQYRYWKLIEYSYQYSTYNYFDILQLILLNHKMSIIIA